MLKEEIILDVNSSRISISIIIDDRDVYDILSDKNVGEKIDIIKRSIKIGMMALKNATITVDVNYVQKEVEKLLSEIDSDLKKNLGKEGMKGELENIFGESGILENRLKEIFKENGRIMTDIFREDNVNSPIYKIKRFVEENSRKIDDNVYNMLDPGNNESLIFRLKEDISRKIDEVKNNYNDANVIKLMQNVQAVNSRDSESIKRDIQAFKDDYVNKFIDIKKSFHEEIGSIKNVVTNTNTELVKLTKEKEVVDITTLKGMKFEDVLYEFLSMKALTKYGDTIDVVNLSGGDKAGDIIINIKDSKEKIIVKAESTSKENVQMTGTILKHLNNTMQERSVGYGIKVYENELPAHIGPVLIGDNKIICSYLRGYVFEGYPLEVAYEILRSMAIRKSSGIGIDEKDIKLHIDNIIRSLNNIQHISGNLTKMENICANTKLQIDDLRRNIGNELDEILTKSVEKCESVEKYAEEKSVEEYDEKALGASKRRKSKKT